MSLRPGNLGPRKSGTEDDLWRSGNEPQAGGNLGPRMTCGGLGMSRGPRLTSAWEGSLIWANGILVVRPSKPDWVTNAISSHASVHASTELMHLTTLRINPSSAAARYPFACQRWVYGELIFRRPSQKRYPLQPIVFFQYSTTCTRTSVRVDVHVYMGVSNLFA